MPFWSCSSSSWWTISLVATALAPFAHESGAVCGVIVGGVVMVQQGLRLGRRQAVGIVLGILLNGGAVLWRSYIPGVEQTQLAGLDDLYQNLMFVLHGLLYPVAPVIGWSVHHRGWHDFTWVGGRPQRSASC